MAVATGAATTRGLGGIYAPADVASYLLATMPAERHPPTSRRIIRWVRSGLVAPEQRAIPGRELVVDFEDLITCQAITLFREAGFSLTEVRVAEQFFAGEYGTTKPFAHHDFWYAKPDIVGRIDGRLVSGTRGGQILMELLESWLEPLNARLGFSEATGLSDCWQPVERVTLRPTVQFGQPCIEGTRIPTGAIQSHVIAGDSPELVARFFGVGLADVERAVAWEDRRRAALAA